MLDIDIRNAWRRLRYEYYVGARTAHISGNYRVSGILFGYAVETSLKHAIIEAGFSHMGVLHSHDIATLMQNFRSLGVFSEIHVSGDFIRYVGDFFKPRYPRLQQEVVSKATSDNLFLLKTIDYICYYDDLVLQVDDAIYAYTNDIQSTIALDAISELDVYNGRVFFHANYLACAKLAEYDSRQIPNRIGVSAMAELQQGVEHLWNCKFMYQFDPRKPDKSPSWHPAAEFEYPRWTDTDGVKSITFRLPIQVEPGAQPQFVPDP